MALSELQINHLRNIDSTHIDFSPDINLIYGDNGSGKTTLLEAIHILGLGRSFRASKHGPMIQHGHSELTVFGRLQSDAGEVGLGVSKDRSGQTTLRCGGENVSSAAELASRLPLLSLTADSYGLIVGPPKVRRSLLDWLAFHVEPGFIDDWRRLQNTLKQRNSLLRRGKITPFELAPWDQQLTVFAEKIDGSRIQAITLLTEALSGFEPLFPQLGEVELHYQRGWLKDHSFAQALSDHLPQDLERGFTQVGPHRADIRIQVGGSLAADVLSRGQQKLLTSALMLAQGRVFAAQTGRQCCYLIDDLPAEFDEHHRAILAAWLAGTFAQVFITGIEVGPIVNMWSQQTHNPLSSAATFHVKQGQITKIG